MIEHTAKAPVVTGLGRTPPGGGGGGMNNVHGGSD